MVYDDARDRLRADFLSDPVRDGIQGWELSRRSNVGRQLGRARKQHPCDCQTDQPAADDTYIRPPPDDNQDAQYGNGGGQQVHHASQPNRRDPGQRPDRLEIGRRHDRVEHPVARPLTKLLIETLKQRALARRVLWRGIFGLPHSEAYIFWCPTYPSARFTISQKRGFARMFSKSGSIAAHP